ncbi:MAG: hypothetical protein IMZ61_10005, partial [Planctomycetes bacterium]|nr:hypothetical protein [Planctomycetota bacterium]
MNENFFDQKEFLDLCKANRIEPMITGNQQLVLMCPKHPGKDIEEKFKTMIPEEVPWVFSEGLSQTTVARIKVGLFSLGLDRVMLQNLPGHRVVIDVISRPDNSPKKGQFLLTLRTSPLWDLISGLLKKDPFVETFAIRFNGTVVRDSSQYVGEPSPIEGAESPFEEEGYQPDTYEQFGHK